MTADERIEDAARLLRRIIGVCANCRGTNRIGVMCAGGTRIEKCHVCAPLREVLEVLTQKSPAPAGEGRRGANGVRRREAPRQSS